MKTYAHYDLAGNIRSLIVLKAPKEAGMMLTPKHGVFVAEIDGLKLKNERDVEALRDIAQAHKIASPLPRCTVIKKG
jgi:hypothetical protein